MREGRMFQWLAKRLGGLLAGKGGTHIGAGNQLASATMGDHGTAIVGNNVTVHHAAAPQAPADGDTQRVRIRNEEIDIITRLGASSSGSMILYSRGGLPVMAVDGKPLAHPGDRDGAIRFYEAFERLPSVGAGDRPEPGRAVLPLFPRTLSVRPDPRAAGPGRRVRLVAAET
jgi:hypothetical protein